MASTSSTSSSSSSTPEQAGPAVHARQAVVVRFAGDSGDGMQLAGTQFTDTSAIAGNDVATLPDYPAEIRAPAGTVAGVSGFQINFAATDIFTPGDEVNALIAMNPAALKAHLADVERGGIVIVNESEFDKTNLKKAGYPDGYNPLDDHDLVGAYQLFKVPITRLNEEALADTGMGAKDIGRCKNMYALGIVYWLYDRDPGVTIKALNDYFGTKKNKPEIAAANVNALKAGYYFGETAELFPARYNVHRADIQPGTYRKITGNEALAMGIITGGKLAVADLDNPNAPGKDVVYCSYPITPASTVLHAMANLKHFGVKTFQAEDEIAAVAAAIGASFAGQLGVTGTSGPGLALKSEAIGLAVITELPLIVVNVQRGGPSTGLPTKTEQSDLLQGMFGRNGDCPVVVIAPSSPANCFETGIEAARLAMTHMLPVIVMTDGYLANGSEPWQVPTAADLPRYEVKHPTPDSVQADSSARHSVQADSSAAPIQGDLKTGQTSAASGAFNPYARNHALARPWAVPGTPGLQHRIGGLEKQNVTGNVNYEPENHQLMTRIRAEKVARVAADLPPMAVYWGNHEYTDGPDPDDPTQRRDASRRGDLLLLGWGGTYGSIHTAVDRAAAKNSKAGLSVAAAHLRYLNPMPANLADVLRRFDKVLIPELNTGQLRLLIRGQFLVDARGLNKVQGKPFLVEEISQAIDLMLNLGQPGGWPAEVESLMPWGGVVKPDYVPEALA